jgi:hypothetical protein
MSVCIRVEREGNVSVVRIEGRLDGDGVRELQSACAELTHPMVLELSGLLTAEAEGVEAIRDLRTDGAILRGGSPYVTLLLDRRYSE